MPAGTNKGEIMIPSHKFNVISATAGPGRADDEMITQNLLLSTFQGDTYQCPRCAFNTQDAAEMIEHLAKEINKSINGLAALRLPTPPLKQER